MLRVMRVYYYIFKNFFMFEGGCARALDGVAEQQRPFHGGQPASSPCRARRPAGARFPTPEIDDEGVLAARLDAQVALGAQRLQVPRSAISSSSVSGGV
jgi:hypothetical protein